MNTPASIKGHPLHVMLVPLPLGLWIFSWVADLVYLNGWGGDSWQDAAFYSLGGGLVGGILAAIPGLVDFFSLTDPRIKKIGTWHLTLNLIIVLLYAVNFWMRTNNVSWEGGMALSTLGVILLGVSGWLGGEMVYKHGVGVDLHHAPRSTDKRSF